MRILFDAFNATDKIAVIVAATFDEVVSQRKDKHVLSLTIEDKEYKVLVNELTHTINALIELNSITREEHYNEPIELELIDEEM